MNKTIVALALALSTVTAVAADIPGKAAPVAPATPYGALTSTNGYVGVNVGGAIKDGISTDAPWTVGLVGGYNVVKAGPLGFGVEGTYDYKEGNVQTLMGNGVASFGIGSFTPYVLAGAGYQWDKSGSSSLNEKVWNVGGGMKYAFTKTLELDARYRRIEDWDRARKDDRVSFGVNYKF
jgi:opacity protein-like surface antigen